MPKFLFVRRISLLIFFLTVVGQGCVLGELGVGVLGELFTLQRRGGLASAAADAVSSTKAGETSAVGALLSSEESRKKMSLGAWAKFVVVAAGLVGITVPPSTPRTPRRSSEKDSFSGRGRSPIFWLEFP